MKTRLTLLAILGMVGTSHSAAMPAAQAAPPPPIDAAAAAAGVETATFAMG